MILVLPATQKRKVYNMFFLECIFVTSFWSEVVKWLEKYQSWRQVLLRNEEILLGFKGGKYTLLNKIILSAKHFIYCCKCQYRRPLLNNIYSYLKQKNNSKTY